MSPRLRITLFIKTGGGGGAVSSLFGTIYNLEEV